MKWRCQQSRCKTRNSEPLKPQPSETNLWATVGQAAGDAAWKVTLCHRIPPDAGHKATGFC